MLRVKSFILLKETVEEEKNLRRKHLQSKPAKEQR